MYKTNAVNIICNISTSFLHLTFNVSFLFPLLEQIFVPLFSLSFYFILLQHHQITFQYGHISRRTLHATLKGKLIVKRGKQKEREMGEEKKLELLRRIPETHRISHKITAKNFFIYSEMELCILTAAALVGKEERIFF